LTIHWVDQANGTLFTYELLFDVEAPGAHSQFRGKQDGIFAVEGFVRNGVMSWVCLVPDAPVVRCTASLVDGSRVIGGVYRDVSNDRFLGTFEGRQVREGRAAATP
jgi:hypothetical protein